MTAEVFRTPDERFENLPGWPYEPRYVDVDGLRIHYVDEGAGDPVVCFHGEPTWSYLYRKMIPPLVSAGHRVICFDYAGFGRSDKPTDRGWYTYDRHSAIAAAVLGPLELRAATVVVQDWGGPIGLRWAVDNDDRVSRLVILNTGLFTGRVSRGFLAWRGISPPGIRICRWDPCCRVRRPPSLPMTWWPRTRHRSRPWSPRPAPRSFLCWSPPSRVRPARPRWPPCRNRWDGGRNRR
ncbi:alpha/beta fold hydrolase [Fodinicola feengrottensis]|uniref:alpha/beta fold hydrolase n=1 Tax=Fodinicola feengrottensis TaxID=435914 RepID=UPI0024424B67|nr:alpha/beta fold hydrolase [Fodinicola feengrottensis]